MTDTKVPNPKSRDWRMPFDIPEGGWTRHHGLDTGTVDFTDSTDPQFFQDELEAVFRRQWLHVGREYWIPEPGDYFTRELPGIDVSLLITRGRDGEVRAFYNMCTHRGNKLVWEDHPKKEQRGKGQRRFVCKYHGWQFDPEGELRLVNLEDWFVEEVDKSCHGLIEVGCDSWEGFIFVNLDPEPKQTLRDQVGPFVEGLAGYPFDEMTQCYTFQVEAQANWKIFLDAMYEQYHGNTLHYKLIAPKAKKPLAGAIGSHFEIYGPNHIWSVGVPAGAMDEEKRVQGLRPIEALFRANLWGAEVQRPVRPYEQPSHLNITRNPLWSNDMFSIFPNFDMLVWSRDWIMVYSTWPVAVDRVLFETRMYFPPPRNASDRLAQELVAVEFKEFLLQDANLLECAQSMLALRVKNDFQLSDEEVLVRNKHQSSRTAVEAYRAEQASGAQR
jgi:phenylpropionate dioxygenase-like ring-hydroxylating dioxygenase large terminal subunit